MEGEMEKRGGGSKVGKPRAQKRDALWHVTEREREREREKMRGGGGDEE